MQTEMEIKIALHEDIAAINALAKKVWQAHYLSIITQEQIDYMLERMYSTGSLADQLDRGHIFLMAQINDVLCGYAAFYEVSPGNYFLDKLYVDTALHGKNIGGVLLDECIAMCKDIRTLRLQVNRKNVKAINFYFKNGFMVEEAKDFEIGGGFYMEDFVMIRKFD